MQLFTRSQLVAALGVSDTQATQLLSRCSVFEAREQSDAYSWQCTPTGGHHLTIVLVYKLERLRGTMVYHPDLNKKKHRTKKAFIGYFIPDRRYALATTNEISIFGVRLYSLDKLQEVNRGTGSSFPFMLQMMRTIPLPDRVINRILRSAADRTIQFGGAQSTDMFETEITKFYFKQPALPTPLGMLDLATSCVLVQSADEMILNRKKYGAGYILRPTERAWTPVEKMERWMVSAFGKRAKLASCAVHCLLKTSFGCGLVRSQKPDKYRSVLHRGRVYVDLLRVTYDADKSNRLSYVSLLSEVLNQKAGAPELLGAVQDAYQLYTSGEGGAQDEFIGRTVQACQKRIRVIEAGTVTLANAPPCVQNALDPERPLLNNTRFQLARIVGKLSRHVGVANVSSLLSEVHERVRMSKTNAHRWVTLYRDISHQLKKGVDSVPCEARKPQSVNDPGLVCPYRGEFAPRVACMAHRKQHNTESGPPRDPGEMWLLSERISEGICADSSSSSDQEDDHS